MMIIKKCSFRLKHWYGMESQFSTAFPFSFMYFNYYSLQATADHRLELKIDQREAENS